MASVTGQAHAVRLCIPAKPEFIALGRLALTGLDRVRRFPDGVLGDMKLALTEACTNSVQHAYDRGEGVVEIVYELHPDRLVVEVTDSGEGFEPSEGAHQTTEELAESGLGIAIIQALTDELEIGARNGRGSRLRFVKHLPG